MTQLSFLKNVIPSPNLWTVFIDGAARNNPGPAGAGVYLIKNGADYLRTGFFLGSKSNNQAEYLALLLALFILKKNVASGDEIVIISDSQLLVRQMNGVYKVRDPILLQLREIAMREILPWKHSFRHVLRHENTVADSLANEGIDKKKPLPEDFFALCPSTLFLS